MFATSSFHCSLLGEKPLPTTLPFVNRNEEIDLFKANLKSLAPDDKKLLVFHGKGGIGKSQLFYQFRNRVKKAKPDFPNIAGAVLDLDTSEPASVERMLIRLRNNFGNSHIDFSVFDFATLLHWTANLTDEATPPLKSSILARVVGEGADDLAVGLANEGFEQLTKEALKNILEEIPLARFVFSQGRKWVVNLAKMRALKLLKEDLKVFYEKDNKTLKPAEKLWELLLPSFIIDLKRSLKKNPDVRFLIMIDQLEALYQVEGARSQLSFNRYNSALQEIISEVSGMMICFFTREAGLLRDDRFWNDEINIQFVEIKGLTPSQARTTLVTADIDDADIARKMIRFAGGSGDDVPTVYPILLSEIVGIYQREPEIVSDILNSEVSSSPGYIEQAVTNRLLKNLDPQTIEMLKCMNLANGFDLEFWRASTTRLELGLTPSIVEKVRKLSVVEETEGRLFLDSTIAKGIHHTLSDEETILLNSSVLDALDQYLLQLAENSLDEKYIPTFTKVNSMRKSDTWSSYIKWLEHAYVPILKAGHIASVEQVWGDALSQHPHDNNSLFKELAIILNERAICLRRMGQDQEALLHFRDAVDLFGNLQTMDKTSALIINNYGECLSGTQNFKQAIGQLERAFGEFHTKFSEDENAAKAKIATNLANAHLQDDNIEAAKTVVETAFDDIGETKGAIQNYLAPVYAVLAWIAYFEDNSQDAEKNFKLSLNCWQQEIRDHVIGAARTYQNYAQVLYEDKKYRQSLMRFHQARDLFQAYYLVAHHELAEAHYNASVVEEELELPEAVKSAERAVETQKACYQIDEELLANYIEHLARLKSRT